MDIQTKLNLILEQQKQNLTIDEIAENLETTAKGIRSFMARQNYKCQKGVFVKKEEVESEQLCLTEDIKNTIDNTKKKIVTTNKKNTTIKDEPKNVLAFVADTTKKTGKLELTPEFLDIIYELRDWYLEVKELPQLKHKVNKKNKTLIKDDLLIQEPISKKIQTDKELWDNLSRLSENSGVGINELITQAVKNLLKDYKHLI